MRYEQAVRYLEKFQRLGIHLGLDRIKMLLSLLGDPHKDFNSIHVAGTNGKGSVCAIMSAVLNAAGYSVGLYSSPHLIDYTERIRICEKDISKTKFASAVNEVKKQVERAAINGLTEFEMITAAAFLIFSREKMKIVIVETGLGGRLDATNVIDPLLSIVTNVDIEHSQILGSTIGKIAREKAGIIKKNIPVVTQEKKKEALDVIGKISKEHHSRLINVNSDTSVKISDFKDRGSAGSDFRISGRIGNIGRIMCTLNGKGQVQNIRTAMISLLNLPDGYPISKYALSKGLSAVRWPARLQYLDKNIIVDGAHNPSGAKFLSDYLVRTGKRIAFVIGMQKDKDHMKFIDALLPLADVFIATRSVNRNAQDPQKLADHVKHRKGKVIIKPDIISALESARQNSDDMLICVTGSLYLAGDLLSTFPAISSETN